MNNLIGQTLRGYEIREQIGAGGYAMVFRAYQTAVRREVALKMILPEHTHDPQFASSFAREARMVAGLEHPYIVPLHDFWQDESGAYLVMRLLRGGSLRDLLKQQERLTLAQTAQVLRQVTDALAAAHEIGVVHRDLKPANVLLDQHGNAYLSDFGIAKDLSFDPAGKTPAITSTEGIKGTPAYMSPEQINLEAVSPRSDIYSLGVMLFEMLTGDLPFNDGAPVRVMMLHLTEPLPLLADRVPELPPALDAVLQTATAKLPSERYPDVQAFTQAFFEVLPEGMLSGSAVRITPASVPAPAPTHLSVDDTPGTPADPAARNRANMLRNVRAFWIDGVLQNSLHGVALMQLGLVQDPNAVEHPWEMVISLQDGRAEPLPPGARVLDVFDRLNGKLLLLGEPGSGKTTTLLELARDLLQRAAGDPRCAIPVVFNLSSWNSEYNSLVEWLADELSSKYQVPAQIATDWVQDDALLLLLDALDEIAPDQRGACVAAINEFREQHGFVDMIVCSRSADYRELEERLKLNGALVLQPLEDVQVDSYLRQFGDKLSAVRALLAEDATLREMSRSPLMLSIITLAYQGIKPQDLPQFDSLDARRKHLLDVYVERMFERRGGGQQPYTREHTLRYLRWLAQQMLAQKQSVLEIDDVQPDWLTPQQRSWYLTFFQLLIILTFGLTAGGITALTGANFGVQPGTAFFAYGMAAVCTGWAITSNFWRLPGAGVVGGLLFGLAAYVSADSDEIRLRWAVATAVTIVVVDLIGISVMQRSGIRSDRIASVELLRFGARAVKPWAGLGGLLAGVGAAVSLNGLSASADQLLLSIGLGCLVSVPTALFVSGLTSDTVQRTTQPNEGMRRSFRNALRMGLVIGCALFIMGFLITVPVHGLVFAVSLSTFIGVAIGYVGAMIYGGLPLIQHVILRAVLAREGVIPWNLARFMDYAVSLIFLRRVGGGYIFVHRYLLEHFASQPDART